MTEAKNNTIAVRIVPRHWYLILPLSVWALQMTITSWANSRKGGVNLLVVVGQEGTRRTKPPSVLIDATNATTLNATDKYSTDLALEDEASEKSPSTTDVYGMMSPTAPEMVVDEHMQWSDVFPGTKITSMGSLSPFQFYEQLSSLSSAQVADRLQNGELKGRHIRSWVLQNQNITLQSDEDDIDASTLAKKYGYDTLRLCKIGQGFVGSALYHALESAACEVLTETGTHTLLLGDSTLSRLTTAIHGMLRDGDPACARARNVSMTHREDTAAKRRVAYYHLRAYKADWEKVDYSVPVGTQRALVIANFDGLHALSLYPSREFAEIPANGRRLFDAWDDFIRYQLRQVRQLLPTKDTFLVTTNVNSVDVSRMEGRYKKNIDWFLADPDLYTNKCANDWKVPEESCRNSTFTTAGVDFLNQRLQAITPVDVDVNTLTRGRGYLSGLGDGRHYAALGRLKVAQFLVVYILRRIERVQMF